MLRKFLDVFPHDGNPGAIWKNFAEALGLLTVALMLALYSSSVGRDGRVVSAVISAIMALALSVWVGLRFIPRFARNVDWHWIPFTSQHRVLREGWVYLIALAVVIFAAVNTSNNLLYMVLSGLLGVLLLSGVLSALNFRFLTIDLRMPPTCFAGEAFPFSVQVENRKRVFPTFSVDFLPVTDSSLHFERAYFPVVTPLTTTSRSGRAFFRRRGRHQVRELRLSSRYPFGFFLRSRKIEVACECVCFPAIMSQEELYLTIADLQGTVARLERGQGYELYTIRDYVYSDSARSVHWKASAKTGLLKTREHASEESRRVIIGFDRYGAPGDAERFEELVSYAASVAFYLIRDGVEVAFVSDDWQSSYGSSETLLESILTYMADVEMSANVERPYVDDASGALMVSLRKNGK